MSVSAFVKNLIIVFSLSLPNPKAPLSLYPCTNNSLPVVTTNV